MEKSINTDEYKIFIALLRELRVEARLTQADLAARIGKDQAFVSRYESGARRLDVIELREICGAFEMSLERFVRRLEKALK
ncbi:MAG TPA: helix-turn-helix transcriptional regulator [Pyrinomonadaceae bacterium]|nr:helix-turn-helix transcriptional regulator [Pyrinomonadaceae bacterium]